MASIMGIGAVITYFTLQDSNEYGFEVLLMLAVLGYLVYDIFRPKGKLLVGNIKFVEGELILGDVRLTLADINMDIYKDDERFHRYHIWDNDGNLSIISIYPDDLIAALKTHSVINQEFKEISAKSSDSGITVRTNQGRELFYNLERGDFSISDPDKENIQITPKNFVVDPKYKYSEGTK